VAVRYETWIEIVAPAKNPGCQPIVNVVWPHIGDPIKGELGYRKFIDEVFDHSGPITNEDVTVFYVGLEGETDLGTVPTNASGDYKLPADTYIVEAGVHPLTARFAGAASPASDGDYPAEFIEPEIEITYCDSSVDFPARFWVSKWRVPGGIEADTYGGLLCIDPNGLRLTNKGPVIFLLDSLNFSPGLTEKSGVMRCQINDNATDDTHSEGRVDMELLREGTIWIQDDDEFWVGVQRGPDPGGNEPHGAWAPTGGSDGEGAGRKWLMGGYVNKRYYRYGGNGDITAVIIGKDYMDVWKDQVFGTPSIPRNYTEATDIGMIAYQVVDDLNSFQPVGWRYTRHPTYFPYAPYAQSNLVLDYPAGATSVRVEDSSQFTWTLAGVPALLMDSNSQEIVRIVGIDHPNNTLFFPLASPTSNAYTMAAGAKILQTEEEEIGIEWKKEFNQEASSNVMTDISDEASYEWRIDYLKQVLLYPRTSAPSAPSIRFTTNIRNLPEIVMGDTTERITHVIVTDATVSSIPPDIDAWCLNPDIWPDLTNPNRGYSAGSMHFPANPADNIYADPTLIVDDEVASALCFQNELVPHFTLNLSIYRDASGEFQYGRLHLDLREWGKLKFRFRHPTRIGSGSTYMLQLHTGGVDLSPAEVLNNRYQYLFGQGTQAIDTIDSNEWTEIELLLPEVDVDGNIRLDEFGNPLLHGWTAHDAWDVVNGVWVPPDPTDINWVSIAVSCSESSPGHGPGQILLSDADAGEQYLEVAHPEYFAGSSKPNTRKTFQLPNTYILEDAGGSEDVRIKGVGLLSTPTPDNIELDKVVINDYKTALGAQISVRGGWTICFSQLHFERKLRYEPSATAPTPPYRYRMMVAKEMENLNEAVAKAEGIIAQEKEAMRPVRVLIDGDPRFEAGYRSRLYLDVDPFDNVSTFIDDTQYELGPDLDLRITLLLGEGDRRSRELTELSVLDAHDRQLRNLGLGRSKTRVLK